MGMLATSICSIACVRLLRLQRSQAPMSRWWYATHILPTAGFMALTFQTGNTGYLYLTMAFVQVGCLLCWCRCTRYINVI
jgi:hypothetical protein